MGKKVRKVGRVGLVVTVWYGLVWFGQNSEAEFKTIKE